MLPCPALRLVSPCARKGGQVSGDTRGRAIGFVQSPGLVQSSEFTAVLPVPPDALLSTEEKAYLANQMKPKYYPRGTLGWRKDGDWSTDNN